MSKPWEKYQTNGQVYTLPPSAEEQRKLEREASRDARQEARDAQSASDTAADNARADAAEARQQAKDEREAREWAAKFNPDGSPKQQLSQQQRGVASMKLEGLRSIASQLDRVESALEAAEKGGFVGPIAGNIPLTGSLDAESAVLDKSIAQLAPLIRQLTRVPGEGAMSDYESRLAALALPSRSDNPAALRESLAGIRALINQSQIGYSEMLGVSNGAQTNQQAENELDKAAMVGDTSPPGMPPVGEGGNDPGNGPEQIARGEGFLGLGGGTRRVSNDRANAMVNSLLNAGASEATINAALNNMGLPSAPLGQLAAARAWVKANPGQRYDAANVYDEVPLSLGERIAGSEIGAGLANYANSATAGTVAALAGERGKGALDAMQEISPTASTIGSLAGGVTGALAGEAVLGAKLAGTAAARFAPRISDTAFGSLYGFNEADDGEGLQGAVVGGLSALGGGYLGEKAMRGVGRLATGVTAPVAQSLRARGVPLTIGQAVGSSGSLGAGVKKIEDALTTVPVVGNMVDARRAEGLEAWNRAVFQDAAPPGAQINAIGAEGVQQLRDAKSQAYRDALENAIIDIGGDQLTLDDLTNASLYANSIPQVGERAAEAIDYRVGGGMMPDGTMAGRDFQEAYRGLGRDGRAAANGEYGFEYGQATRQAQDALGEALERQNPGAFDGFLEANAANRRLNVLSDAVTRAANQSENLITPAQLNRADVTSTSRLNGRIDAASGNRPFYDLANAGQEMLPSKLPDSGTWTRAIVGSSLTGGAGVGGYALGGGEGAATGTGLGATLAALLAAGGTRTGQRAAVSALLDRPEAIRAAGEAIARNAKLGSGLGSGVLTPLLVSP